MSVEPYISSDDSALLRRVLGGYSGGECLEIGTGNAGALLELGRRFSLVVGTDIVPPTLRDWRSAAANMVLSDRASCFRDATFDLVAFNPPYLRHRVEDGAVDGGERLEIPMAFLAEALRVVKPSGAVVWLMNGEADVGAFKRACGESGFRMDRLESARLFFEELTVYAASKRGGGGREDASEGTLP